MQNTIFGRRGLSSLALAAMMTLALPATRTTWAASASSPSSMIQAHLPPEVSVRRASKDQLVAAVKAAVKENPDQATSIVQTAILLKRHERDFKDRDFKSGADDCDYVRRIVRSAISSAPDRANDITQMALSLCPECADSLNSVGSVDGFDPNNPDYMRGYGDPNDLYGGFGVGFGPGFPGSPGFAGSAPIGATALPPATPVPLTAVQG